jgi:hypothetical protein
MGTGKVFAVWTHPVEIGLLRGESSDVGNSARLAAGKNFVFARKICAKPPLTGFGDSHIFPPRHGEQRCHSAADVSGTAHERIHTWMGLPRAFACECLRTSEAIAAARMRSARFDYKGGTKSFRSEGERNSFRSSEGSFSREIPAIPRLPTE